MTDTEDPEFLRATPVLRSADYHRSRAFYTGTLGFTVVEEGGDPPRFGIFRRGGSTVFINAWQGGPSEPFDGWTAYLHVTNVDALHSELAHSAATISRAVENTVYGMREFDIRDPDGNVICFGEDIE